LLNRKGFEARAKRLVKQKPLTGKGGLAMLTMSNQLPLLVKKGEYSADQLKGLRGILLPRKTTTAESNPAISQNYSGSPAESVERDPLGQPPGQPARAATGPGSDALGAARF
jgi:hypothetical protein